MADTDAFAEMEAFAAEEEGKAVETTEEVVEEPEVEQPEVAEEVVEEAPDTSQDEAFARSLGWRPQGEWKGKPEDWQDAGAFLERARHTYSTVRKMERQAEEDRRLNEERFRKFGELAEMQRKRAVSEVEARMKQAREDLDFEAYDAASKEKAKLEERREPDLGEDERKALSEQVGKFRESNEWAKNDFVWARVASEVAPLIDQEIKAGRPMPVERQLAMTEQAARALFPDAFAKPTPKPTTAAVDGGGLRQPGKRAETGWDDLPADERAFLSDMIKSGDFKDRNDAMKHYRATFKG